MVTANTATEQVVVVFAKPFKVPKHVYTSTNAGTIYNPYEKTLLKQVEFESLHEAIRTVTDEVLGIAHRDQWELRNIRLNRHDMPKAWRPIKILHTVNRLGEPPITTTYRLEAGDGKT